MKKATIGRGLTIAVLGPKKTYTDAAASKYEKIFKKRFERIYFSTIAEVFEAVEKGKVEKGIVPLENFLHGSVRETFDQLFCSRVQISQKIRLPIQHVLGLFPKAALKTVRCVFSHDQALHQCNLYLRKYLPKAERIAYSSTTAALEAMLKTKDPSIAAILPLEAAKFAGLKIIKDVQDQKQNHTIFVVIERGSVLRKLSKGQKYETSIAFHFLNQDRPGSLFSVFKDFAEANVNLTRIESRPSKKEYGDYVFFLDFIGHPEDSRIKKVLKKVWAKTKLKILGTSSFPPA